jgi:hypothetical protein
MNPFSDASSCAARQNWRADPLVRAGRPRPALLSKNQALATIDKSARQPAANEVPRRVPRMPGFTNCCKARKVVVANRPER